MYVIVADYGTPEAVVVLSMEEPSSRLLENYRQKWGHLSSYSMHKFLDVIDQRRTSADNPYPLKSSAAGAR